MLKHAIDLPGVGNARELGGYAIGDRRVKDGVLLRTGDLGRAAQEAIERLHSEYHVQTVVDLRMNVERDIQPDPQIPGATNRGLSIIEMEDFPIPDGMDPSKLELLNDPTANRMEMFELAYESGVVGPNMYVSFLTGERGKKSFADFFSELLKLEDGRAILWHCTDGKDRTGCVAMLVLSALGADRQTVLEDFLLTNAYNTARIDAAMRYFNTESMSADKLEVLRVMVGGVEGSYMERAMDVLEERYGSVKGYLLDELGVGQAEIDWLRDLLLV